MSDRQEQRTADRYRGSRTPGSGAGWKVKNDVRTHDFLIENKCKMDPAAKSYSIQAVTLRDLRKQAIMEGRIGLLQIDLGGRRYVVLEEDDFLEMIGADDGD